MHIATTPTQKTQRETYIDERKKRGTQAGVAAMLEVTRQCIQRRENGKSRITREAMLAIRALPCATVEAPIHETPSAPPFGPSPDDMERYAAFVDETRNPAWRETKLLGTMDGKTYDIEAKNRAQLGLKVYAESLAQSFAKHFPGCTFSVTQSA